MTLISRFAIGAQRDLQFEDMRVLAEAEAKAFHGTDVAIFPFGDFQWLLGHVGSRPLHAIALWFHGTWIDVEDLVLKNVYQQIALPEFHQQHTALGGVINIPRGRSFIVEAHDGKRYRLPFDWLAGFGGLRPGRARQKRD